MMMMMNRQQNAQGSGTRSGHGGTVPPSAAAAPARKGSCAITAQIAHMMLNPLLSLLFVRLSLWYLQTTPSLAGVATVCLATTRTQPQSAPGSFSLFISRLPAPARSGTSHVAAAAGARIMADFTHVRRRIIRTTPIVSCVRARTAAALITGRPVRYDLACARVCRPGRRLSDREQCKRKRKSPARRRRWGQTPRTPLTPVPGASYSCTHAPRL